MQTNNALGILHLFFYSLPHSISLTLSLSLTHSLFVFKFFDIGYTPILLLSKDLFFSPSPFRNVFSRFQKKGIWQMTFVPSSPCSPREGKRFWPFDHNELLAAPAFPQNSLDLSSALGSREAGLIWSLPVYPSHLPTHTHF